MFNEKIAIALNDQMNYEFFAAHSYLAMAAYCEHRSYTGFAHYYIQQAAEERYHGMRIYNYLNDRGVHPLMAAIEQPKTNFETVLDTFETALRQEKDVTKKIYELTDLAWAEKEHATISFLNWFLDEQVEEEASFETHIDYLKRIGDDKNALYLYEKELGKREFTSDV